jgi:hypothetical protein
MGYIIEDEYYKSKACFNLRNNLFQTKKGHSIIIIIIINFGFYLCLILPNTTLRWIHSNKILFIKSNYCLKGLRN